MPLNEVITPATAMMWIASRDEQRAARFYRGAIDDRVMWLSLVSEIHDLRKAKALSISQAALLAASPEDAALDPRYIRAKARRFHDAQRRHLESGDYKALWPASVPEDPIKDKYLEPKRLGVLDRAALPKAFQNLILEGVQQRGWRAWYVGVSEPVLVHASRWDGHRPFAYNAGIPAVGGGLTDTFEFVISSSDVLQTYPVEVRSIPEVPLATGIPEPVISQSSRNGERRFLRSIQLLLPPETRTQKKAVARKIVEMSQGAEAASKDDLVERVRSSIPYKAAELKKIWDDGV